ncbi:60S ribosomal protein l35a [Rozella allomycis CSF55]|uniref:60S ribosomal protein l35a n=1 Tax=Rozella allomycis (strain CSF55) TaxID=988480 RepID=A0A4P9YCZ0_ROZAC|nr:60S ribosomal protein l35a [Rozella allomycis CSF55]
MTQPIRLYCKARILGFKRGKRSTDANTTLLEIENVQTKEDTAFYLGKRVAYVYRARREKNGSHIRCIWGKITRSHGNTGAVRAQFKKNLPAKTFGASARVMMYPSSI